MKAPVSLALFDVLIDYAEDIRRGRFRDTRSVARNSPALVFSENFYAQMFQNVYDLGITALDSANKSAAVGVRLGLRSRKGEQSSITLIMWFEHLCDIYPDVLALHYGTRSQPAFREFHNGYLITLLSRIVSWARAKKLPTLEKKARSTKETLKRAMRSLSA